MTMRHHATRWVLAAAIVLAAQAPGLARTQDYRLGYGDALTVTVVGQPSLSVSDQPVRPDGRITLPLVQQVEIQGKTVAEVTAALNQAFKPFLTTPQVVVTVARFRPLRVTVLGQVAKPGTYAFEAAPTLVDLVATAGGLTDRASRASIRVVEPGGSVRSYDLDGLLAQNGPMPTLGEGSVVEIGEVWGPDLYRLIPLAASVITAGALLWRYGLDNR
ncbi:MAG: polysaccharide biosynthesis/export family protein, partial [Candidatus Sericytochromatia bacterium]